MQFLDPVICGAIILTIGIGGLLGAKNANKLPTSLALELDTVLACHLAGCPCRKLDSDRTGGAIHLPS